MDDALKAVRIEHLKDKSIYKLSGGEKKLASIATVLSMTPDILVMDEPSNGLDPGNRRNLIHILNRFSHLKLIASHDLDLVLDSCERTILMNRGRIVKDGRTQEILRDLSLIHISTSRTDCHRRDMSIRRNHIIFLTAPFCL